MQLNLFMFLLHFPFLSSFECFSQDFKLTDNRNRLSLYTGGINPSASANCSGTLFTATSFAIEIKRKMTVCLAAGIRWVAHFPPFHFKESLCFDYISIP